MLKSRPGAGTFDFYVTLTFYRVGKWKEEKKSE